MSQLLCFHNLHCGNQYCPIHLDFITRADGLTIQAVISMLLVYSTSSLTCACCQLTVQAEHCCCWLQVMREQEEDAAAAQHVAAALEKKKVQGLSKVGRLASLPYSNTLADCGSHAHQIVHGCIISHCNACC